MMLLVVVNLGRREIDYGGNGDPSDLVAAFAVQEELEEFERQMPFLCSAQKSFQFC
jgi:hypothetical protein